jgi:hypothetical protein
VTPAKNPPPAKTPPASDDTTDTKKRPVRDKDDNAK